MTKLTQWQGGEKPAWLTKLETATGQAYGATVDDRAVYLVIDHSGSMAEGSKMHQARRGARQFAEKAGGRQYKVGLIAFANAAEVLVAPHSSRHNLDAALERLIPDGGTDMVAAIDLAARQLTAAQGGEKVLCIVTDGMPNDAEATLAAAREAKRKRIDIMAIGTDDADKAFLERLVTRRELAAKVDRAHFAQGVAAMALLLPKPRS